MQIPFNSWSQARLRQGQKFCTSRTKLYHDDPRVLGTAFLPWWFIKNHLYQVEGASSPEELERIMTGIQRRKPLDNERFYVHFGDFRKG